MALGAFKKVKIGLKSLAKGQTYVKTAPKDVGRPKLAPESLLKGKNGLKGSNQHWEP